MTEARARNCLDTRQTQGDEPYPSHEEILRMLQEAQEVTYLDAVEYGLGSTFHCTLSDTKLHSIISYDKSCPTRYGTKATIKAHRLGGLL